MPSFLEGLAGSLAEQGNIRQKGMLELAMLSKRIELEQQARMAEMEQQHKLNMVPGEQIGALADVMKTGNTKALAGMEIPGNLGGAALSGIGMGNRIPAISFEKTTDPTGREIIVPVNRKTGEIGTQGQSIGLTPTAGHEVANAGAAYGTMHNTLENIKLRVAQFLGAQDASQIPAQYTNLKLNQLLQNNPDAKAYFDDLPATSLRIDKELTGSSRFAANIVESTNHGLPQMTDTLSTAMAKLNNYDNLGKAAIDATYDAYKVPKEQRNYGAPSITDHVKAGFDQGVKAATEAHKKSYLDSLMQQYGSKNAQ